MLSSEDQSLVGGRRRKASRLTTCGPSAGASAGGSGAGAGVGAGSASSFAASSPAGRKRGVALVLKIAQQNIDVERAWAVGIGCALGAGTCYALFGLVGRLVTPWSRGRSAS